VLAKGAGHCRTRREKEEGKRGASVPNCFAQTWRRIDRPCCRGRHAGDVCARGKEGSGRGSKERGKRERGGEKKPALTQGRCGAHLLRINRHGSVPPHIAYRPTTSRGREIKDGKRGGEEKRRPACPAPDRLNISAACNWPVIWGQAKPRGYGCRRHWPEV